MVRIVRTSPIKPLHNQTTLLLAKIWRGSNDQTKFTAACSGFVEVQRDSNKSNGDQTVLTAACSDCALTRRGSKESNHDQTMLTMLMSTGFALTKTQI